MAILVAGGAGYIGSHMVKDLIEHGYDVVVADNLSTGHKKAINPKAKFYYGDIRDRAFLDRIFVNEEIEAVVHFAAFSIVPESMSEPLKYFDNNTSGMVTLWKPCATLALSTLSSAQRRLLMVRRNTCQLKKPIRKSQSIHMVCPS